MSEQKKSNYLQVSVLLKVVLASCAPVIGITLGSMLHGSTPDGQLLAMGAIVAGIAGATACIVQELRGIKERLPKKP